FGGSWAVDGDGLERIESINQIHVMTFLLAGGFSSIAIATRSPDNLSTGRRIGEKTGQQPAPPTVIRGANRLQRVCPPGEWRGRPTGSHGRMTTVVIDATPRPRVLGRRRLTLLLAVVVLTAGSTNAAEPRPLFQPGQREVTFKLRDSDDKTPRLTLFTAP